MNENINQMLMERYLNKQARRSSHKNHMKGPRKCTEDYMDCKYVIIRICPQLYFSDTLFS